MCNLPDCSIPYGLCHCGCGQQTKIAPRTLTAAGQTKGVPLRYFERHACIVPISTRLWVKVDRCHSLIRCWRWRGSRNSDGYGHIRIEGRTIGVHRIAWTLTHGPIAEGMQVLHKCDNPSCVRPSHLFLGTVKQNIQDMSAKGRHIWGSMQKPMLGERNVNAKLTAIQIEEIRGLYDPHIGNGVLLGCAYGVDSATIYRVVHRSTWKHVQ